MAAAPPEDLLDELTADVPTAEVRDRVERYGDIEGVDAVCVGSINGATEGEKETSMAAIAELV